ncbi:Uu.00g053840.m01.CDS01 [Anthostomella pinea]|uniref:Proline iminopeptidase n=1 Tax=Anthostomella pinea TaxID=933095 RepID=A0AAI8VWH8_9PEZI|nr:Uu.00g053840.m01.CDS01 [Anthostomella pinea]
MAQGYTHEPAYETGHLKVGSVHEIYYEQYGKKDGLPVIFLHGGPGGNTSPGNAKYFNPAVYRVVLMDQRGAGKSRPRNELRENTTQHLCDDIEALREHLGIAKWHMVFGGSWGSTLALYYTQKHADCVGSMSEIRFKGEHDQPVPAEFFPMEWERFLSHLSEDERRGDPMEAYYRRITSSDPAVRDPAAREWNPWGMSISALRQDPADFAKLDDEEWCLTHALFESHYLFKHSGWMEDGYLLRPENMAKIGDVAGAIVQGRYDLLCTPKTAWEVSKKWPKAELHWVDDAGHSAGEPGTTAKLVEACDSLAKI